MPSSFRAPSDPGTSNYVRHIVTLAITVFGGTFALLFGLSALRDGNTTLAAMDLGFAVLLYALALWTIKRPGQLGQRRIVGMTCAVLFSGLLVTGGAENTGILWSILIPATSFFLLGFRGGLVLCGGYGLFLLLFFASGYSHAGAYPQYPAVFVHRFLGVSIVCGFVSMAMEYSRVQAQQALEREIERGRQIELELSQREASLRALYEEAPLGIYTTSAEGRLLSANHFFANMLGYDSPAEVLATITDVTTQLYADPQDRGRLIQRLAGQSRLPDYAVRFKTKQGDFRWVSLSVRPEYAEDGALNHYDGFCSDIHKRKQLELRLAEQLTFQQALLDTVPYAVFYKGADSRFLGTNKAYEETFGIRREELVGKRVLDLEYLPWEDRQNYQAEDEGVISSAGRVQREVAIPFADGQIHQTLYSVSGFCQADGTPGGLIGLIVDITDRRAAEESLRISEEKYREIFSHAPVGIFRTSIAGKIIEANPTMARMLGYESDRHLMGAVNDLSFDNYPRAEERARLLDAVAAQPEGVSIEIELKRRDGTPFYAIVQASLRNDEAGRPAFLEGTVEDITERKRAEERLQASELRWRMIIETSMEGIFTMDSQSRITYLNHRLADMVGYEPEELIGRHISELAFSEDLDAIRDKVKNREAGVTERYERRLRRKDGGETWTLLSATPLQGGNGEYLGSMAMFVDITELKHAESALREATRQAESANRAKSDFLATMSHEIRTPMNAVLGMAHLALVAGMPPKQEQYVRTIERAGRSLLALLNDILDFSKIEAGMLACEQIGFNLDEVLEDVTILAAPQAAAKGLEFCVTRGKEVPTALVGDPLRLRQVLVNFVGNAVKFTEQGEVCLDVDSLGADDLGRMALAFSVRDTGIGMAPEQVEGLFRPFTQADSSTTRRFGGTGLGLSISKRFCELMGGEVRVRSSVGRGSTFRTILPFALAEDQSLASTLVPEELRQRRVLVAVAQDSVRNSLVHMLEGLGFAANGVSTPGGLTQDLGTGSDSLAVVITSNDIRGLSQEALRELLGTCGGRPVIFLLPLLAEVDRCSLDGSGESPLALERPVLRRQLARAILHALGLPLLHFAPNKSPLCGPVSGNIAGRRVLLVEDIPVNQVVAEGILAELGLVVVTVDNGLEALRLVQQERFDAVLMDIEMPVMDGYEATRRIRQLPGLADLPIIAMTAHAFGTEREAILGAGLNDHISKPIEPPLVASTLFKWIPAQDSAWLTNRPQPLSPAGGPEQTAAQPKLPGINTEAGLARFLGKAQVYESVLRNTLEQYAGHLQAVEAALSRGAAEDARQLVHAVRGVAGNIGAEALHRRATDLEAGLHSSGVDVGESLQRFAEAFRLVLAGLTRRYG